MAGMGALPARFRRERVLVVGCGDVGMRVLPLLRHKATVLALTSSPERVQALRAAGCRPLLANLDEPVTLARLAGIASRVLHLAPPPTEGAQWQQDPRTRHLTRALARRSAQQVLVYGSTSGVYGDCAGNLVSETQAVQPSTPRAQRRVDAEQTLRQWSLQRGTPTVVLRIPGIYAPDRVGGTPRERLLRGTPVLQAMDDVYTNHIHATDLARACHLALWRGARWRKVNVNDDSQWKMGDYMDAAADLMGLPRPPRVSRETAQRTLPMSLLSFMGESRRMDNIRMKTELGLVLRYATPAEGLVANAPNKKP